MRAGEDGGLDDVGVLGEHRLDLRRRHVLAARDDHVALAARHHEPAVGVEPAQVAGAQAPERVHRAARDDDLAVGRDGEADARDRPPGRLEVARLAHGHRRARLREAVARADRQAGVAGARQQRRAASARRRA